VAGFVVPVRLASVEAHLLRAHGSPRSLTIDEIVVFEEHVGAMVEDIQAAWPVDTSTSRDAFEWYLLPTGVQFEIANDTDYAEWIHRAKTPAEPPLWETLIPEVFNRHKPKMIADLMAAIDATEAGKALVAARARAKSAKAEARAAIRASAAADASASASKSLRAKLAASAAKAKREMDRAVNDLRQAEMVVRSGRKLKR
jgi:hypothetical protein